MRVLSLFDGMSCGQIALNRAKIAYTEYYASEVDKYAIKVAQTNYPNTIQLGDIRNIKGNDIAPIDLLIGGSPCQGFSFAGKQLNFEDERSKLFFEYVRLLNELKPRYFLLENVQMKKESKDIITSYMGIEPVMINSALVSAQNRKRLYWTNIPIEPLEDKGILLQDILESSVDIKYYYSDKAKSYLNRDQYNRRFIQYRDQLKGNCITANYYKSLPYNTYVDRVKSNCILKNYANMDCRNYNKSQGQIVMDDTGIRRLTTIECERLQTVPDNYTAHVSDSQRYKMLGNGWTVDIIAHIFKGLV